MRDKYDEKNQHFGIIINELAVCCCARIPLNRSMSSKTSDVGRLGPLQYEHFAGAKDAG